MRFTVLGSGTAIPDSERGPAGFALSHGGRHWWIDGGSGTLQRSMRAGIDPLTLAGGVYSHHHPDHCADLIPLLFAMRVANRELPYPIWAGTGFRAFADRITQAWGKWCRPPGGLQVHELPLDHVGHASLGSGVTLTTRPAAHSAAALHLRFEAAGAAVVFSGDTGPSRHLIELATGADLLVCECASSQAQPLPGHLSPSEVADIVDLARPREVWLTHFYPGSDPELAVQEVARTGVKTRRAQDGDVWSPTP